MSSPELTVVVPTLNERDNIAPLIERFNAALAGAAWEAVFVDDDSRDGTLDQIRAAARRQSNIRLIRRVHRRGLAGAAIEGMLSSTAPYVALIDADLQHDETKLPQMLEILRSGTADIVIASRFLDAAPPEGLSAMRHAGSKLAIALVGWLTRVRLSDPMSGFFMVRAEIVDRAAPRLSTQGFKILLDLLASSPVPVAVREIPFVFGKRMHGESKLDALIVLEYLSLLCAKASGDVVSARFLMFCLVGATGVVVNLSVLGALLGTGLGFAAAQTFAILGSMGSNYLLNNWSTYRDRRRRGWRLWTGMALFVMLCSVGVFAGVSISTYVYGSGPRWWLAGLAGAAVAACWNYVTNSAITWRRRLS